MNATPPPMRSARSSSAPSRALRRRRAGRTWGVGLFAVVGLAACGIGGAPAAVVTPAPVETVGSAPQVSASQAFADDFASRFSDLVDYVGVGVAGTGVTTGPFVAGDRSAHQALGTLTLPLALTAVERADNSALAAVAQQAVGDPRSPAVAQLWARLGGGQAANFALQRTLAKTSTAPVIVDEALAEDAFGLEGAAHVEGFGRTRWDVAESAVFGASLLCRPGGATVLAATGPVVSTSALGSASQTTFRDATGVDGQSLLRQVSIVAFGDGRRAAVALAVRAPDEPAALRIVGRIDAWLGERLEALPRGTCAGRGRARPTATPSLNGADRQ